MNNLIKNSLKIFILTGFMQNCLAGTINYTVSLTGYNLFDITLNMKNTSSCSATTPTNISSSTPGVWQVTQGCLDSTKNPSAGAVAFGDLHINQMTSKSYLDCGYIPLVATTTETIEILASYPVLGSNPCNISVTTPKTISGSTEIEINITKN